MKVFPCFVAKIDCIETEECVIKSIADFVGSNPELFVIPKAKEQTVGVTLQTVQSSWFFRNSFLPDVHISCFATHCGSRANVLFELKKSIKIVMGIYFCLGVTMETALIAMTILGDVIMSPVVFLPVFCILFGSLLSVVCLKLFSNRLLRLLAQAVSGKVMSRPRLWFLWFDSKSV